MIRDRWAQVPGPEDASRFLAGLRCPTRASTVRAVIDGVIVTLTLKKRGVRPLLAPSQARPAGLDPERAAAVSTAVDAGLALIPVAPTCLRRSVTLLRELNRLGLASALHIGVQSIDGVVSAHAWVQVGDVVVNDDPEVTREYSELASGELEKLLPLLR